MAFRASRSLQPARLVNTVVRHTSEKTDIDWATVKYAFLCTMPNCDHLFWIGSFDSYSRIPLFFSPADVTHELLDDELLVGDDRFYDIAD